MTAVRTSARAIAFYESALRVYTEADFPSDWAATQDALGTAYVDLPTGDRSENLRRAISFYESVPRVYTEAGFPEDWARIQHNLGIAYSRLPTGDRGENLTAPSRATRRRCGSILRQTYRGAGQRPRIPWALPTGASR